jgi:hypothetical protein
VDSCAHKQKSPSLISVLGLTDDAGNMMVDGMNFPLPPAAAVRPLGLSGLANREEGELLS